MHQLLKLMIVNSFKRSQLTPTCPLGGSRKPFMNQVLQQEGKQPGQAFSIRTAQMGD